jgi:NAD(P)-dependent dehydrogenase (short-subunit alcohol dehydrogenase family)
VAHAAGAAALPGPIGGEAFDVVVLNAGVYGPRSKGLEAPTAEDFDTVMHTNGARQGSCRLSHAAMG